MGLALDGLAKQFAMNQWNVKRFQQLMAGAQSLASNSTPSQIIPAANASDQGQTIQATPMSENVSEDQMMRVDSDNVQYNMYTMAAPQPAPVSPVAPTSSQTSPLVSLGKAALLATGIGVPASIGMTLLPEIIKSFSPPPVVPVVQPVVPTTPVPFDMNNFDLYVGPPKGE